MDFINQSYPQSTVPKTIPSENSLSLYDRYGSLVYGIICKIIPEPELAQRVLVDLFSCPEVNALTERPFLVSAKLIQLARTKALAVRPAHLTKTLHVSPSAGDDLGRFAFDMTFYQGYDVQQVADKLQLTPASVLKMIAYQLKQQPTTK